MPDQEPSPPVVPPTPSILEMRAFVAAVRLYLAPGKPRKPGAISVQEVIDQLPQGHSDLEVKTVGKWLKVWFPERYPNHADPLFHFVENRWAFIKCSQKASILANTFQRIINLYDATLQPEAPAKLTVAVGDSLLRFLLPTVLRRWRSEPNPTQGKLPEFSCVSYSSNAIVAQLQLREVELGYAWHLTDRDGIQTQPISTAIPRLICHATHRITGQFDPRWPQNEPHPQGVGSIEVPNPFRVLDLAKFDRAKLGPCTLYVPQTEGMYEAASERLAQRGFTIHKMPHLSAVVDHVKLGTAVGMVPAWEFAFLSLERDLLLVNAEIVENGRSTFPLFRFSRLSFVGSVKAEEQNLSELAHSPASSGETQECAEAENAHLPKSALHFDTIVRATIRDLDQPSDWREDASRPIEHQEVSFWHAYWVAPNPSSVCKTQPTLDFPRETVFQRGRLRRKTKDGIFTEDSIEPESDIVVPVSVEWRADQMILFGEFGSGKDCFPWIALLSRVLSRGEAIGLAGTITTTFAGRSYAGIMLLCSEPLGNEPNLAATEYWRVARDVAVSLHVTELSCPATV